MSDRIKFIVLKPKTKHETNNFKALVDEG
uniref:Uncharacterized protein n=1 Tax=Rhizophora mucronata TaxID=61149 RepID=A0A2P2NFZ6_RHIMU